MQFDPLTPERQVRLTSSDASSRLTRSVTEFNGSAGTALRVSVSGLLRTTIRSVALERCGTTYINVKLTRSL